jgi:hypothetical protein
MGVKMDYDTSSRRNTTVMGEVERTINTPKEKLG